jgi:hypothetical protein
MDEQLPVDDYEMIANHERPSNGAPAPVDPLSAMFPTEALQGEAARLQRQVARGGPRRDIAPSMTDFLQSFPTGVGKGLARLGSAGGQAAAIEMGQPEANIPSPMQARQAMEQNVTGPWHEPTTQAGQLSELAGEIATDPLAYLFSPAVRAASKVGPAAAMGTAGGMGLLSRGIDTAQAGPSGIQEIDTNALKEGQRPDIRSPMWWQQKRSPRPSLETGELLSPYEITSADRAEFAHLLPKGDPPKAPDPPKDAKGKPLQPPVQGPNEPPREFRARQTAYNTAMGTYTKELEAFDKASERYKAGSLEFEDKLKERREQKNKPIELHNEQMTKDWEEKQARMNKEDEDFHQANMTYVEKNPSVALWVELGGVAAATLLPPMARMRRSRLNKFTAEKWDKAVEDLNKLITEVPTSLEETMSKESLMLGKVEEMNKAAQEAAAMEAKSTLADDVTAKQWQKYAVAGGVITGLAGSVPKSWDLYSPAGSRQSQLSNPLNWENAQDYLSKFMGAVPAGFEAGNIASKLPTGKVVSREPMLSGAKKAATKHAENMTELKNIRLEERQLQVAKQKTEQELAAAAQKAQQDQAAAAQTFQQGQESAAQTFKQGQEATAQKAKIKQDNVLIRLQKQQAKQKADLHKLEVQRQKIENDIKASEAAIKKEHAHSLVAEGTARRATKQETMLDPDTPTGPKPKKAKKSAVQKAEEQMPEDQLQAIQKSIEGFQEGGMPPVGKSVIVGESGPELALPGGIVGKTGPELRQFQQPTKIVPNAALQTGMTDFLQSITPTQVQAKQAYPKATPNDYQGAEKIIGDEPEHEDRALLENTIRETGKIRIWPGSEAVQQLLNNLPNDMEVLDVQEFGIGHENNTIIIRSKRGLPPTS